MPASEVSCKREKCMSFQKAVPARSNAVNCTLLNSQPLPLLCRDPNCLVHVGSIPNFVPPVWMLSTSSQVIRQ